MILYIAKNKNGKVYLHTEKPAYDDELEGWYSTPDIINVTNQFPEFDIISYTDEPVKVELNIKNV